MDKQFINWKNFCEEKEDFDSSDFYTLFMDDLNKEQISDLLKYFPNENQITERILNIKSSIKDPDYNNPNVKDLILSLAKNDLQQKKKACIEFGDDFYLNIIEKSKYTYTDDIRLVQDNQLGEVHHDFISIVDDYLSETWIDTSKKMFALAEAFYGFTNNYNLVWYLMEPLMDSGILSHYYFKLWSLGSIYALTEENILVSRYLK